MKKKRRLSVTRGGLSVTEGSHAVTSLSGLHPPPSRAQHTGVPRSKQHPAPKDHHRSLGIGLL